MVIYQEEEEAYLIIIVVVVVFLVSQLLRLLAFDYTSAKRQEKIKIKRMNKSFN